MIEKGRNKKIDLCEELFCQSGYDREEELSFYDEINQSKINPSWMRPLVRCFHTWVREQERKGKVKTIIVETEQGIEERLVLIEPDHEND